MKQTKKQKEIQAKIIEAIYVHGPISRIDIAHLTGTTPATVSATTGNLIKNAIIEEVGEDSNGGGSGRKKILLDIKKNHQYFIGIELSEKFITFCLTDNTSTLIEKDILEVDPLKKEEILTTETIAQKIHSFINSLHHKEISAIGIAIPGHHAPDENYILTNSPLWRNLDLNRLSESFDVPMYFENNVKCMLISKRYFNSSSKDENFILHHISRGIFSAYMYNGELFAQGNRLVGEVGHTTIQMDGELCECGNRGCLQTFSSEGWLIKKAQIIYQEIETSYLRSIVSDVEDIDFPILLKAYKLGDPLIIELLQKAIQAIATNIINLSMIIDVQTIYIHGNIYEEPALLELLEEIIADRTPLFSSEKEIKIKKIPYSPYNGAMGANALCISEAYTKY